MSVEGITLERGAHNRRENGMCAMEAVAWLAGEEHSDAPSCTSPVIAAFVRQWNDDLEDDDRQRLLKPLLPQLLGTAAPELEEARANMIVDWLARECAPAWLRLAGLTKQAEAAARAAAWAAASAAARAAASDAAWKKLAPTTTALQASAVLLIGRLCAMGPS